MTRTRSDAGLVRRLWPFARKVRGLMALSAFLMVAEELLPFAGPHCLRRVVDLLDAGADRSRVHAVVLMFLAAVAGAAAAGFLRAVAIEYVSAAVVHALRTRLWSHLLGQGMSFFHRRPVGELMSRLNNDVDSVNRLLSEVVLDLTGSVLMLVFGTAYMLAVDWRLALCCLAFLPPMLWATHVFRVRVRDSNRTVRAEIAELSTSLQENLDGAFLVRAFGLASRRAAAFGTHNRALREAWFGNVTLYSLYFPTIHFLTELATASLFLAGAWLFRGGHVGVGTLAAFSWTMGLFFRPLRELSDRITNLQQSLAAAERVFQLLDERTAIPESSDGAGLPAPRGSGLVEFHGVTFGYDPERPVVRGIDLRIEPGKSVALVGPTGGGKSTLAALLCRFHDPQLGRVLLDGRDLREIPREERGHLLGIVPQEPYLFPGSILENVALGREVDRERVRELLREVRLGDFVDSLPAGLDTQVGERGARLSTGQRQLLSFARALCHDPAVLILDEATASIDSQSEEALQEVTRRVLGGRSTLVIAHRLSTVRDAAEILVLAHGEIRERGSHDELLARGGLYDRLWRLQAGPGAP